MILPVAFAIVLPSIVMYAALVEFWIRSDGQPRRILAAAVAPALGIGAASCVYFILLLASSAAMVQALDAGLWLLAGGWLLFERRRRPLAASLTVRTPSEWRPLLVLTAGACAVAVLAATVAAWLNVTVTPHGQSDAIAIWNLRARSVLRSAPDWGLVLSPAISWSQPDYPLLVPLTVARLWSYAGVESLFIPQFVAMLFFLSSVATVGILVGEARGWIAGTMSALAVVAARTFVFQTSCQCADVPLGFFVLVAISFAVTARERTNRAPWLAVAGAAAALGAWTKNEGQLLLVVVALFVLAGFPTARLRATGFFAAGAALPVAAVAVFKLHLSPPGGFFALQTGEAIVGKLADPARWAMVLSQMWALMKQWGGGSVSAIAGVAAAAALAAKIDRVSVWSAMLGMLLVLAVLSGYTIAYVITPWPLAWHIATSFERLIVQLWPATVWALFQLTGTRRQETGPVFGGSGDVS